MGKLERSEKFDGEYYQWRHSNCFFGKFQPSYDELKGADELKWADQEALRAQAGGDDDGDESEEDPNELGFCCEYAKSGRSTCKGCNKKITNKLLRIGHTVFDEDGGYERTSWYHVKCADLSTSIEDVDELSGYGSLKAKDKKVIAGLVKKLAGKRKREDQDKAKNQAKKRKGDAAAKKLAEELWNTKEELEDEYTRDQITAILKIAGVSGGGGPSERLTRLADIKINGTFDKCPECENPTLSKRADRVVCSGNISEWSKCTYSAELATVQRKKFKMPDEDDIDDMVQELKDNKAAEKQKENDMVAAALGSPKKKKAKKAAPSTAATSTGKAINKMTVAELKKELKILGEPISGKKAVLAARLESSLGGGAATAPSTPKTAYVRVDEGSGFTKDQATVYSGGDGNAFAAVLNKTDLGVGNLGVNSFYKMQILQITGKKKSKYIVYNRWGRVGQEGNTVQKEFSTDTEAVKFFVKNFLAKTGNTWQAYTEGSFVKVRNKLYPVEVGAADDEAEEGESKTKQDTSGATRVEPRLAKFLRLIFDENTILTFMKQEMNIDTKKMPLGKLSKTQLNNGTKVLEAIEKELKKAAPKASVLADKSNQFYTLIPHDFGEDKRPPALKTLADIRSKYELLNVLGDIEIAANIMKQESSAVDPLLANLNQLDATMETLDHDSDEFQKIQTFAQNTKKVAPFVKGWCNGSNVERSIIDVFKVNRLSEGARYAAHEALDNRKLLWHGTNVAVVAAIVKGGLRIMPHSGGRVGRGIYLASENNKSASYVQPSEDPHNKNQNTGIMFICEAALGKSKTITKDQSSLKVAPPGFDSVLALGQSEPDPAKDSTIELDGQQVVIPQGKPIKNPATGGKSNFTQSEYLVYKESQVRLRLSLIHI